MKKLILLTLLAIGLASCEKPEEPEAAFKTITTFSITEQDLLGRWKMPFTTPQGYYTFKTNNNINRTFTESKNGVYTLTGSHLIIDIDSTFFDYATHFDLTDCYISNDTLYGKQPNQTKFYKLCYR